MRVLISITILTFSLSLFGQNQVSPKHCFKSGEKLKYIASYSMKGIMTELAGIEMEVINVEGKKKPIYQLKFTANTLTTWDDYVKVRHSYQTYVDAATLKPLIMAQDSDIKGYTTKAKYTFKHKEKTALLKVEKSDVPPINKSTKILDNTFDIVSLLYYVRDINFQSMQIGNTKSLSVLFLENLLSFNLKYLGTENIQNKDKENVNCYKVAIELERKFIVEPKVSFIWISADERKVPIQISTIFKEGQALIKLIDY